MDMFANTDLLSVGVAVAGMLVLGFSVFFNNKSSATNKTFLLFSLITVFWSLTNYIQYQIQDPETSFLFIRLVVFFATWHAFSFFLLSQVFPKDVANWPKYTIRLFLPATLLVSILTLTPIVFSRILVLSDVGRVTKIQNGPGLVIFSLFITVNIVWAIFNFIKKTVRSRGIEKRQNSLVLIGLVFTFILIFIFNFLMPAFFDRPDFIPLGALFIFPFIAFTSYAIIKHGLLNVKIIATEILTFILAIVTFIEVIFADELAQIIFRSSVFMLVLVFGILLIRSVQREVSQREKIEILAKDLSLANDKLKDLDRQKTEFLSIASHQLRAPLTAIKGYSSLILENSFGEVSEKVRGAVDVIFQSSQKLVTVIEDFLNITRIELGKMKYDMSEVDMKQMVETAIKELRHQVETRNLSLNFNVVEGISYKVKADSGKIAQVITNLIDNAIKYTKEGGINISLSAGENGNRVRLAVKDTGIGLTPETASHLFEKFSRAMDAGKTNIIGTGLGLYVAKQIVEAHKGKIWVESEGPGKGSTFYVELQ